MINLFAALQDFDAYQDQAAVFPDNTAWLDELYEATGDDRLFELRSLLLVLVPTVSLVGATGDLHDKYRNGSGRTVLTQGRLQSTLNGCYNLSLRTGYRVHSFKIWLWTRTHGQPLQNTPLKPSRRSLVSRNHHSAIARHDALQQPLIGSLRAILGYAQNGSRERALGSALALNIPLQPSRRPQVSRNRRAALVRTLGLEPAACRESENFLG